MTTSIDLSQIDWLSVLPAYQIPRQFLTNRHGPCPICGTGKDRFRFDNKENKGTFFCNCCGAGSGIHLIHLATGLPYKAIYQELGGMGTHDLKAPKATLPNLPDQRFSPDMVEKNRRRLKKVWSEGIGLAEDDPASKYLLHRVPGVDLKALNPMALRFHKGLDYMAFDSHGNPVKQGTYPVLLAKVVDGKGIPVTIHRTYLTPEGRKAPVGHPKKLMPGTKKLCGAAIRLTDLPEVRKLAVCEGIETGLAILAAHQKKGKPVNVWSLLNCGNLAKADIPEGRFDRICIYADNDQPGIQHALQLQKRLKALGYEDVQCRMPAVAGQDFADVWKLGKA